MPRRSSHKPSSRRSRKAKKGNSSSRFLIIGGSICAIAVIGLLIWWLIKPHKYSFQRSQLDKYVEKTQDIHLLDNGASVYVDMSDGMNYAYSSIESQAILQAIINKLAANPAIKFYYCPLNHKIVSPTSRTAEVGLTFCIGQAPSVVFKDFGGAIPKLRRA